MREDNIPIGQRVNSPARNAEVGGECHANLAAAPIAVFSPANDAVMIMVSPIHHPVMMDIASARVFADSIYSAAGMADTARKIMDGV